MKSLVRWSITLGLVGTTVLGAGFGQNLKAFALPQDQILQKLKPIPVFTIADDKGAPLVASENNKKIAGVFISQQDAQKFVERLQKGNPELARKVKVVPVSLSEVYQLAEANAKKQDGLNFAYVPTQAQVDSAKQLLGKEYKGGVPLFVARGGKDNGYLTVQQNNQEVIPFFFEKQPLQQMLDRFKQEKPDLASTIKIEVVPLEGVISALEKGNDAILTKIMLVPTQESIDFLRSNSANANINPQSPQQKK